MSRHERRARQSIARKEAKASGETLRSRLRRANKTMRELLQPAFEEFDAGLHIDLHYAGVSPDQISCRSGCASCCEMNILISLPEAALIVGNHREVVEAVRPELERQETLLGKLGLTEDVLNIFRDEPHLHAARKAFNDAYWAARIPCAFLDRETKTCRIYASRPLACRAHMVVSDPALCAIRPLPGMPATLVRCVQPHAAYDHVLKRIYTISQEQLGGPSVGALQVLVLSALETSR